jgi:hypothetical protein
LSIPGRIPEASCQIKRQTRTTEANKDVLKTPDRLCHAFLNHCRIYVDRPGKGAGMEQQSDDDRRLNSIGQEVLAEAHLNPTLILPEEIVEPLAGVVWAERRRFVNSQPLLPTAIGRARLSYWAVSPPAVLRE